MSATLEAALRQELADAYQLAWRFQWHDTIYTHFSVKIPDENTFLMNPFGLNFNEITPENLVKMTKDGEVISPKDGVINYSGHLIHGAIHEARPEVYCIIHTHTNSAMALSMLDCGLLPLSQHSCRFYNNVAYHDYEGIVLDPREKVSLVKDLGTKNTMVLKNHGFLTMGGCIGEAFIRMYNLEKAAQTQLIAMSTGKKLTVLPDEVALQTFQQFGEGFHPADVHAWAAFRRMLRFERKI